MSAASTLLESFLVLLLVCGLAFAVLLVARRAGVARAFGAAELVGQLPLEPRRSLYLVKIGGRVLVVGASEAGLSKLGELEATDVPKADGPVSFADALARALGRARASSKESERDGDGGPVS